MLHGNIVFLRKKSLWILYFSNFSCDYLSNLLWFFIMSERSEKSFFWICMVEIFIDSTRIGLAWPTVRFFRALYLTAIRLMNMKQKPKDAHFSEFKRIKFLNQWTEPSEHEMYPNSENSKHFLKKLTFVSVLSLKL